MKVNHLLEVTAKPVARLSTILWSLASSTNFKLDFNSNLAEFGDIDISQLHSDPKIQARLKQKQDAKTVKVGADHPDEEKEITGYLKRGYWAGEIAIIVIDGKIDVQLQVSGYDPEIDEEKDVFRSFSYKLTGDAQLIANRIESRICGQLPLVHK